MILNRLLQTGGTMTGHRGGPWIDLLPSRRQCGHVWAVQCQVELQRLAGGNASIGRNSIHLWSRRV